MDIDLEKYLERFRVFKAKTLFEPDFNNLQKNRCPICGRKLYLKRDKSKAFCKSKLRDGFVIDGHRLLELGGSFK